MANRLPSLLDAPLSCELPTPERKEDVAAMNKLARSNLVPLLVVRDAARAIDFYVRALGANEIARYMNVRQGTVSHADLAVDHAAFSVKERRDAWAPPPGASKR
jgi:hypothetical protein